MIVGHGDIASVLNDREGVIFFASGVSNSQCTDQLEFAAEWTKIQLYDKTDKMFVYFSSIICERPSEYPLLSEYLTHKQNCEYLVSNYFKTYCIIRLGNIDWGKNPHTFLNFIRNKQAKGEPVEIRDEYKYMISKEQLLLITDNLPLTGQHEISVFGRMAKVKDLI
jgi:hypothetical protein